MRFFRACADSYSISTKFFTSIPWADVVIYLNRHLNWLLKGFWEGGVTLALASNTAYCATAHTRDYRRKRFRAPASQNPGAKCDYRRMKDLLTTSDANIKLTIGPLNRHS